MSILSEQEREGLEDVFLSISSTPFSALKWSLSNYLTCWKFHFKETFNCFFNDLPFLKKRKNTLKWTIFPRNYKKIEKHR